MSLDSIRVDSFLLADSAQVVDGKLYVLGGGWNAVHLRGPDDPFDVITVAGRILVPWQRSDRNLDFLISLDHEDSEAMLAAPRLWTTLQPQRSPETPQSAETATPFAFKLFGLTFPRAGAYAFVIRHEGEELARTRFQVHFTGEP